MNAFARLGTAVLLLSLGTIVPAFAQQEAKPEQKQQQEHTQPQHAQPQQQHAQAQPQHVQQRTQQKQQPQAAHAQQQNQNKQQHAQQQNQQKQPQQQHAQQQNQNKQAATAAGQAAEPKQTATAAGQAAELQQPAHHTQEQQRVQQAAWQGHRSQNWQSDHRTWQQRGGYHGYRIPDNRYNGYFGSNHGSSSTANLIWLLAGSRASSTVAIGSAWLIRGQGTGQTTGTKPTTFMLSTLIMDTTCTTRDTLASALQSAFRCKALRSAAVGRGLHFGGAARREGLSAKGQATLAVAHMSPGALEEKIW